MTKMEAPCAKALGSIWAQGPARGNTLGVWRSVLVALGAVALAWQNGAYAAGIFTPVDDGRLEAVSHGSRKAHTAKPEEWRVRVAHERLNSVRDDVAGGREGRLLLNMREGVNLDVVVERTAPTRWGYSLSGRIAGGSVGFVTLVVHEEAVAGHVWSPDASYEIHPLPEGIHALRRVTSAPEKCGSVLPREPAVVAQPAQEGGDGVTTVDILVVWTPTVEDAVGSDQVLTEMEMFVAFANDAFERSGALISLNLVGAESVDYLESYSSDRGVNRHTMLSHLTSRDDGYMDAVHDQRDLLGADLVHLVAAIPGGVASGAFATSGSYYSFAHEVGHNFGVLHERIEKNAGSSGGYQHGFTTLPSLSELTRLAEHREVSGSFTTEWTIMAYGLEAHGSYPIGPSGSLPFYASPWRYSPRTGAALGVSRFSMERGSRGPADAVLTLNRNRHRVANLRPSSHRD